ncbi:MAG: hypothetical protein MK082_10640 [Phycisphaerales bacterium]|nr:hypothetical protein [Phycisphaerales bacterium]
MTSASCTSALLALGCLLITSPIAMTEEEIVITFDESNDGWSINGSEQIDPTGGNPGPHLYLQPVNTFGVVISSDGADERFIGNFFEKQVSRMGLDIDTVWIGNASNEFTRHVILELRDYDAPPYPYQWVSVWYDLGEFPASADGWESFSVPIPLQEDLPEGWGGTGDEDPKTYEPRLPENRTYGSVLRGVDEALFTSFVPGQGYGSNTYEIRVDNITLVTGAETTCSGDIDMDGTVDGEDLTILLGDWGSCDIPCPGDVDGDGMVDGSDLTILLGQWGACQG